MGSRLLSSSLYLWKEKEMVDMFTIKLKNLEICFERAKKNNHKFVAVKIEMEGFPEAEVIINPIVNADSKLAYYKKTYNEELNHNHAKGIKIIGCTFGDSMNEIEENLMIFPDNTEMMRVYDDRTNENLFEGSNLGCIQYMRDNFDEDHKDFPHIWVGKLEERK